MLRWPVGRVVPDGWAAYHRPVVSGFFPDRVVIQRQTGRIIVDDLGTEGDVWTDVTPAGGVPALIQVVTARTLGGGGVVSAESPLVVSDYYGRVDVEWLPETGDRLIVTASPDPANLGTYVVRRRESQGHVVDRTVHLERVSPDTD